jgi:hypothetical protein
MDREVDTWTPLNWGMVIHRHLAPQGSLISATLLALDFVRQEVEHLWAIKVGHPVLSLISIASWVLKTCLYTLTYSAN